MRDGGHGRRVDLQQAAGVDAAQLPAVRAGEVDQLASGEVQFQHTTGLVVDLLPGRAGDGGKLALQKIHHRAPFRLPIPRDTEEAPGVDAAAPPPPPDTACFSTSVMGPLEFR